MFRIRISYTCRFNFEADIVLCTVFARCNTNDVTIPHVLCIEKKHCVLRHQFQRGVIGFRKPHCGDPEHQIILCEITVSRLKTLMGI